MKRRKKTTPLNCIVLRKKKKTLQLRTFYTMYNNIYIIIIMITYDYLGYDVVIMSVFKSSSSLITRLGLE